MQPVADSQSFGQRSNEPAGALIRLPATLARVGIGRSAWLDLVRQRRAPQPIKIGRATLWVAAEVDAWIGERVRQSRGGGR